LFKNFIAVIDGFELKLGRSDQGTAKREVSLYGWPPVWPL